MYHPRQLSVMALLGVLSCPVMSWRVPVKTSVQHKAGLVTSMQTPLAEKPTLSQEFSSIFEPTIRPLTLRPESQAEKGMWLFEQPHEVGAISRSDIRMTVYKLADGSVVVYNPISPTEETLQTVAELIGQPDHIVIPTNSYEHLILVRGWAERFPLAMFWGLKGVELEGARKRKDLTPGAFLEECSGELDVAILDGSTVFRECFLLHKPTRSVFAIDSFNHFTDYNIKSPVTKVIMQAMGTFGRPACSVKFLLWNREGCRETMSQVLSWDFETVLPTHGKCPVPNGKQAIKEAFNFLL
ncbi:unnamed protein product [Discosporangium mesarthrocarpum]